MVYNFASRRKIYAVHWDAANNVCECECVLSDRRMESSRWCGAGRARRGREWLSPQPVTAKERNRGLAPVASRPTTPQPPPSHFTTATNTLHIAGTTTITLYTATNTTTITQHTLQQHHRQKHHTITTTSNTTRIKIYLYNPNYEITTKRIKLGQCYKIRAFSIY